MEEIWKPIEGFDGAYEVSNFGRVRSLDRIQMRLYKCGYREYRLPGRIMAQSHRNHYPIVKICRDNVVYTFQVHRLVASAFIPNPNNLPEVNHKDEVKHHNTVGNLEWCDRKYNVNYGTCPDRIRSKSKMRPVAMFNMEGELIRTFSSLKEAERWIGKPYSHIWEVCSGKTFNQSAFGYRWSFIIDGKIQKPVSLTTLEERRSKQSKALRRWYREHPSEAYAKKKKAAESYRKKRESKNSLFLNNKSQELNSDKLKLKNNSV